MNIFLKAGLSNLPEATNGKLTEENSMIAGILNAANLFDKNWTNVSLSNFAPFLR